MKQGGENQRYTPMIGKAGEHVVAGQLLARNLNVYWPSVDTGCDLLAENGCRIQVKCGHVRSSPSILKLYKTPVYTMHFPKNRFIPTSATEIRVKARRKFSEYCDIVVFWGIEENRFWIIPAAICDVRQCVVLGPMNDRKFAGDLAAMQEMVDLGYSQKEIGKQYGMNQSSVYERLQHGNSLTYADSAVVKIRACEGAWETILNFGEPAAVPQVETSRVEEQ